MVSLSFNIPMFHLDFPSLPCFSLASAVRRENALHMFLGVSLSTVVIFSRSSLLEEQYLFYDMFNSTLYAMSKYCRNILSENGTEGIGAPGIDIDRC